MADDIKKPGEPEPGPGGRLDPGAGAELYAAAAADGGIDLSGLEAGAVVELAAGPAVEEAPPQPPPPAAPPPATGPEAPLPPAAPPPATGPEAPLPPAGPPPETGLEAPLPPAGPFPGPGFEAEAPPQQPPPPPPQVDDFLEDDLAGAAAAQAESLRVATREARDMDTRWLRLPYLAAALGFLRTFFLWLWRQFKAIPPMDDMFDQVIFSMGMQRKAPSMLRRAASLAMQGRLKEAVKWYRDILALRPLSVAAYDGLGQAYFRQGLVDEANLEFTIAENLERLLHNRDDLEAAAALALAFLDRHQAKISVSLIEPVLISHFYAPTNSELLKAMGRVYQELRSNRKLYQVYAAGLAQHPEDYEYYLLKGGAEQKLGNIAEGERLINWGHLMKTLKDNPEDSGNRVTMGKICFKENKPEDALKFLREAAALDRGNADFRVSLAGLCFKENKPEDALKFLRSAATLDHDDKAGFHVSLAEICFKENKPEDALKFLHSAAALDRGNADFRVSLAEICFKENKPEDGLMFLREAAVLDPDNGGLRMNLGEICFKKNKPEDGLKFLCEAAALTPDNTGLRWRLYNLYMKQDNIDEALRYFQEIVALDPDNDDLQYRLGEFCRKHRRREEALPVYKALAQKYPRDPKPHALWGDLLLEMGQMEEGKRLKDLAKLLSYGSKENPDHYETVAFMKYLFSIGRNAEAYEWLERGLEKWPYHGELVMIKVKLLFNEYQYKEAVPLLKRLISVRPDVAEPHIWIAMCYQRLGDNMAALAEAQLSTRLAPKSYTSHKVLGDILKEQKKTSQANAAYEVAEMMRHKQGTEEDQPGQRRQRGG